MDALSRVERKNVRRSLTYGTDLRNFANMTMVTVAKAWHIHDQRYVLCGWRVKRLPRITLWLYFGELMDDIDGPSYDEEWFVENGIRLHGSWRDPEIALAEADSVAAKLRAMGFETAVDDIPLD